MPSMTVFGKQLLVSYLGTHYTALDVDEILDLYNITNAKSMYHDSKDLVNEILHPMVDVHCFHGNGHATPKVLVYDSKEQFPFSPEIVNGPGDGDVNINHFNLAFDGHRKPSTSSPTLWLMELIIQPLFQTQGL
ncbi:hypothetical protein HDE_09305 [Halotydeus destructor]|nr:hypothetical protein HDE_09305 [Halotydeus destructor]